MKTNQSAPALAETPAREPSAADRAIDRWFVETFHNIGLDTPLFNRFSAARHDLKSRLAALTPTPPKE